MCQTCRSYLVRSRPTILNAPYLPHRVQAGLARSSLSLPARSRLVAPRLIFPNRVCLIRAPPCPIPPGPTMSYLPCLISYRDERELALQVRSTLPAVSDRPDLSSTRRPQSSGRACLSMAERARPNRSLRTTPASDGHSWSDPASPYPLAQACLALLNETNRAWF